MKKILCALILGIFLTITLTVYSDALQKDVAQNVLRLHILANSDSAEDQALKLSVRDRLLEESRLLFADCKTPQESEALFLREKDKLLKAAKEEIQKKGYSYDISLSLENTFFPTKQYDGIAFPAGEYRAVRVCIGKAEGQNWWCVMFPPLCFVKEGITEDTASRLAAAVGDDAAILTPDAGNDVKVRFKVVDFFQSATHVIKKALDRS